jgi:plasmid stabilization system protein ParE
MKLRWLPATVQDIERLYEFLLEKDPGAAARAMEIILSGAQDLEAMPEMSRPMNGDTSRRELFLPFGAGAYGYRLDGEAVVMIRIWHSREYQESD